MESPRSEKGVYARWGGEETEKEEGESRSKRRKPTRKDSVEKV